LTTMLLLLGPDPEVLGAPALPEEAAPLSST
jgi:hypothetical protein